MQKKPTRLKHVSFLLTEEEREALKIWCFINKTSVSKEVRHIVRMELGLIRRPEALPKGGAQ